MILAKRLGVPYVIELSPKQDNIIIIFGAHDKADTLHMIQQSNRITYIIMQTEQFESKQFDNKYYMELIQNNPVIDWSKSNVERIKSRINAKVYSLYFYDFFMVDKIPPFESREIDFFFCGTKSPERELAINQFKQANPSAKFEIDYSYSFTNPYELTKKLLNVKYVLNMPFYKNSALETHRINRALSLGCEVISTLSYDTDMNKKYSPYVHFVSRLSEFTPLLEHEPRGNYQKLLDDFGTRDIENNIRAIQYAERRIIETRVKAENELQNKVISDVEINNVVNTSPAPLRQPVSTDFSKFLAQKKLNENKKIEEVLNNVDSSV
jgi:hypothetical protein